MDSTDRMRSIIETFTNRTGEGIMYSGIGGEV